MRDCEATAELMIGEHRIRPFVGEIQELRLRCGQQDDETTDPLYFIASNTLRGVSVVAVLIRQQQALEGCVFFCEHARFGIGIGLLYAGNYMGDGVVAAPEALRIRFVYLAIQALMRHWRMHGVVVTLSAPLDDCIKVMGSDERCHMFEGRNLRHKLPLKDTYQAMLAGMGPRTRRSLAGKRRQLEKKMDVVFAPALEPAKALQAMLSLRRKSRPDRIDLFYEARYGLLCERPEFFCMGMRLGDHVWLSLVSGWRCNGTTYVDMQMNDMHLKKESLSAVMRAFMLEHEIARGQKLINFVGGTSLLLKRYCLPSDPCTDVIVWKRGLRARMAALIVPLVKRDGRYEHLRA